MSDDYSFVAAGSLKLKKEPLTGISQRDKKKKKKHKQKRAAEQELLQKAVATLVSDSDSNSVPAQLVQEQPLSNRQQPEQRENSWMTEAERKFLAQQEKRQLARVMAKANKTHKQRVEEFNSNLEKLSEHYDIPKVSWTK